MKAISPASGVVILPSLCALGMVILVLVASRFERDFRANLERGFQQRVELGDLASSVQQLRKALEFPRLLDGNYVVSLTERVQEVEQKVKAQNLAGRVVDLSFPTKELSSVTGLKQEFERLASTAAQIERIHVLRSSLKPPDLADSSAIKRVSNLIEDYANATAALRGNRGGQQSIAQLGGASLGLGENLQAAVFETRRKGASPLWRDVLGALPTESGDFADRLLADARLLEDFQVQRTRALGRLEQVSAKIDSAERLLLGAKADGGLLVASTLLSLAGLALGLCAIVWSTMKLAQRLTAEGKDLARSNPVVSQKSTLAMPDTVEDFADGEKAERVIAERVAQAVAVSPTIIAALAAEATIEDSLEDEVTSGYWIAAGSMSERRVALLDKQSVQLEQHVKSVLASVESLAGRADLVVQNLQLVSEDSNKAEQSNDSAIIRKRVDELQSLAINLSLQVASGEVNEPVLDDLERFNQELELLASEVRRLGESRTDTTLERRYSGTLEEGRRLIAAADTLKERAETLYEDAQRFRRHSEALIRGIQEGAITEVPLRLVRDLRSLD
ncbi:MAG: hypothetical protein EBU55_08425 [Betaproteobacteria bacterium]|nr:hypothetical protein [Betaproteobacteria bacterium]